MIPALNEAIGISLGQLTVSGTYIHVLEILYVLCKYMY